MFLTLMLLLAVGFLSVPIKTASAQSSSLYVRQEPVATAPQMYPQAPGTGHRYRHRPRL